MFTSHGNFCRQEKYPSAKSFSVSWNCLRRKTAACLWLRLEPLLPRKLQLAQHLRHGDPDSPEVMDSPNVQVRRGPQWISTNLSALLSWPPLMVTGWSTAPVPWLGCHSPTDCLWTCWAGLGVFLLPASGCPLSPSSCIASASFMQLNEVGFHELLVVRKAKVVLGPFLPLFFLAASSSWCWQHCLQGLHLVVPERHNTYNTKAPAWLSATSFLKQHLTIFIHWSLPTKNIIFLDDLDSNTNVAKPLGYHQEMGNIALGPKDSSIRMELLSMSVLQINNSLLAGPTASQYFSQKFVFFVYFCVCCRNKEAKGMCSAYRQAPMLHSNCTPTHTPRAGGGASQWRGGGVGGSLAGILHDYLLSKGALIQFLGHNLLVCLLDFAEPPCPSNSHTHKPQWLNVNKNGVLNEGWHYSLITLIFRKSQLHFIYLLSYFSFIQQVWQA